MHSKRNGFSLIELTIVILVLGIMMGGMITLLPKITASTQVSNVKTQMSDIQKAIINYVQVYGHLPCPASTSAALDSSTYGTETDCTQASATGTVEYAGASSNLNIRFGYVPTRALNLPDSAGIDPWNRRIAYGVVKDLAKDSATFNAHNPAGADTFIINDIQGNRINQANSSSNPNYVAYTLVSFGEYGNGSTERQGTYSKSCDTSRSDKENCNNDKTLIDSYYNTSPTALFDNHVLWQTYQKLKFDAGLSSKSSGAQSTVTQGFSKYGQFTNTATNGGNSSAGTWNTRSFNTTKVNTLSNASLQNTTITLGAGEYFVSAHGVAYNVDNTVLRIYNVTSSTVLNTGAPTIAHDGNSIAYCSTYINTNSTIQLRFDQYTQNAATNGLGSNPGVSPVNHFTVEIFEK